MLQLADNTTDLIYRTVFESPGWVIVGLAFVWAVLRVVGRRTDNKRLMHLSWIAIGLVGALLLASSLVTTERERLPKAIKALLRSVEEKQIDRFRELVDPEAMTSVFGRERTRDQVEAMIQGAKIDDLLVTSSSVVFRKGAADAMILVRADGTVANTPGIEISEWAIRWELVDGQWRATRLECTAIGADAIFNGNRD